MKTKLRTRIGLWVGLILAALFSGLPVLWLLSSSFKSNQSIFAIPPKLIGVTGQQHGILYLDGRGEAVSPLYTWQDGRGGRRYRGEESYADWIRRETGCQVSPGYGLVTHFWLAQNGQIPERAAILCTICD